MNKFTCSLVLLALLGLGFAAPDADASPKYVVYFDEALTQRTMDSPGAGMVSTIYIAGQDFDAAFINGAEYSVDYGTELTWLADFPTATVRLGNSPTGISLAYGFDAQPGAKFLLQTALVQWNSDCTAASQNANIRTDASPQTGREFPIATRFPDVSIIAVLPTRSQTCQFVELDIDPGACPNNFNSALWGWAADGMFNKGGQVQAAILGSAGVDVFQIDVNSISPPPLSAEWTDVATGDGNTGDCACNGDGGDGHLDLVLKFQWTANCRGRPRTA
jgi:hypothetical protein